MNDDKPKARHERIRGAGIELCRPYGAGNCLCRLPRADALGYLLDAPTALADLANAIWIALESHQEFLGRPHVHAGAVDLIQSEKR
jgi:hypothetical protein